jgi:predicted Rossmann fold nucleotide-binding protein DprA/Smf involved in DNA uptake
MSNAPLSPEMAREALAAMEQCGGNQHKAAALLNIARSTLQSRLRTAEIYRRNGTLDGAPVAPEPVRPDVPHETILAALRKQPMSLQEIAARFNITKGVALDTLESMETRGVNLHQVADKWSVEKLAPPAFVSGYEHDFVSGNDNIFRFCVMAYSH